MRPRRLAVLIATCCVCFSGSLLAQSAIQSLRNNPFSRPEILNAPPPPPAPVPVVVLPPEQVELRLTATMVSETYPMVIVDGEMLGLGEEIEGLKLIAVMEGEATFERDGRKFSFMIVDSRPNK